MSANSGRDHEFANKRFDMDFTEENCHKVVGTPSGSSFYMQLADIDFFKSKVEFLRESLVRRLSCVHSGPAFCIPMC